MEHKYPEIKNVKHNRYYAYLLQKDYAGLVSEITAINLYLYDHFILAKKYEKTAQIFERVAIEEMHHMHALGKAIIAFGGDPKIGVPKKKEGFTYWKGSYFPYKRGICRILNTAIKAEYDAIAQYQKHIKLINKTPVTALLTAIIEDEKQHIELFKAAKLDNCCK
ncbi:bacterioferritin [Clostridium sp. 'deep sea']|uniref:ferritin-like domain-containing protein n=1 Tax=Clostridium sp. 'deep sea' TaxID=2779445 RepID=UPI00189640F7|nr:ferritin family protein [Clostridium sp. 'deep sea']QOR33620.1 bacterioferritin [Clostridium sp. 'deep sea']